MTQSPPSRHDAFVKQLEAHTKIVAKVANAYSRTAADRDDLTQEIVAALWGSFPRFDDRLRFSTWAYRVALNVAISFNRAEKRRTDRQTTVDTVTLEAAASTAAREHSERSEDERIDGLNAFIATLGDIDKALMLLYLDRYSYDDIASTLGLTETNVATKLNRIKHRARTAIERGSADIQGDDHGN